MTVVWRSHKTKRKKPFFVWCNNLCCRKVVLGDKTPTQSVAAALNLTQYETTEKHFTLKTENTVDEREPERTSRLETK